MRRLSMLLLLCAVGLNLCVNAHPYSKIPDSIQLGDGFTSQKSSLSSSSTSYSHSNQDNIAIDGVYNGQAFSGSKTSGFNNNGGSHSKSNAYSSASVNGVIPIGLISSSASSSAFATSGGASDDEASHAGYGALKNPGTGYLGVEQGSDHTGEASYDHNSAQISAGHGYGAASTSASFGHSANAGQAGHVAGTQYWWNSKQSPFVTHGQAPSAGCTPSGCSASGSLHITNHGQASGAQAANEGNQVEIKLHGNPFLSQGHQHGVGASSSGGSYASGSASASGSSTSGQTGSRVDVSKNPFLNGVGFAAGSSSGHGSVSHHGASGSYHGSGSQHDSGSYHGSGSQHDSGSYHGSGSQHDSGSYHGSGNQHDSGSYHGSGSQHTSGSHHGSASTTGHAADSQTNGVGSGNPFFNSGSTGSGSTVFGQQVPQIPQIPQIPSISSGSGSSNVFGQVPQVPQVPQFPNFPQIPDIPQISQEQENVYDQQQTGGFPSFPAGNGEQKVSYGHEGGLSVSCNGQGKICVSKSLCSADGYVINNHIHQVRSGPQVCKVPSEVCCNLKSSFGDQSQAGTHSGHSTIHTNFGTGYDQVGSKDGGIFGNANGKQEHTDLSTGEVGNGPHEGLFDNSKSDKDNNGYLPPLGSEPSSNVPAFSKPPAGEEENEDSPTISVPSNIRPNTIFPPAPVPPPQVGCAAALICVEEQFCTLEGVISPEPVTLSSEQLIRRVPLSSCKNPDNGVIGKCCRDPNYVDPWPAGNLPANYSGGFDEQGFPTFLNIAKTRPPKKQPPTSGGATKGGRPTKTPIPQYKPQINQGQGTRAPSFPPFSNIPNQIANIPNHISTTFGNAFQRPTEAPVTSEGIIESSPGPFPELPSGIPNAAAPAAPAVQPSGFPSFPGFGNRPNKPPSFPNFPNFPNFQNPFGKNNVDASSSNENPTVIAPHVPGSHCGIRNKVQRPNGLSDVDVAFGEIPWQAMILSNRERKLLCSGAIVAPNAIVTAARCVDGFKANEVSIKAGEWKLGYELKHEEPLPFEIINVASIAPYPGYSSGNPANDVAILFLEHDIKLDQHVDMLCLPQGQPQGPKPGRKCIATGWGKTILQVNVAGSLMHSIDVDVLSNDQCQERISGAESHIELDNSLVCTKAHRQNNNMCQVDLGGPLACDRGDGYYELAGVYNQDTGCLPTNQVATFATIPTSWVQKMMANPPTFYVDETQSPTSGATKQVIHNHGPNEPCDCQKSTLPSENNQYLPPQ